MAYPAGDNGDYVRFATTSFSPFTVVYDKVPTVNPSDPTAVPQARITEMTEYVGVAIDWKDYSGYQPTEGYRAILDAAYKFEVTQTAEEVEQSNYREWYCDFYVSLDRDLGANEIFLGGNYGDFGWIGFHNGDLELAANEWIPLLGSALGNGQSNWTYEQIADFVDTFICGVGSASNNLVGATFTVELRLMNPEIPSEYKVVSKTTHTFEAFAE